MTMPLRLVELRADDVDGWLPEALDIYVSAMRYPLGTEQQRAPQWREQTRRAGWRAVGVTTTDAPEPGLAEVERLVGVAYGYRGASDQWWNHQLRQGMRRAGYPNAQITAVAGDYFELTELHVAPGMQGAGIGEALLRELLRDRPEAQVLLSTPEAPDEDNRAWRLYRRLGFADVLRDFLFAGDPRPFAVLGRRLPL